MTANREAGEGEDPIAPMSLDHFLDNLPFFSTIFRGGEKMKGASDAELRAWANGIEDTSEQVRQLVLRWRAGPVATHLARCHDALRAAREVIAEDRRSLIETISINGDPTTIDPRDVGATAEYDATLALIDEALK